MLIFKAKFKNETISRSWEKHPGHVIESLLLRQDGRVVWFSSTGLEDITEQVEIEIVPDPYTVDASHTDPIQIETAAVLKAKQELRECKEVKDRMIGFLDHYFKANETNSRVNIHIHRKCEELLKEIQS